ncbi:Shedu immune nuclease family protein [Aquibacillus sediminis]|uniref:Shedu immune nuclease family protein n=1 Tax=Aquibacillus sediminis TaxID=2574734 RepID=UPI001108996F|nr:Shedu immune nuclease family protein [Aquibacillus sediminis]
MSIFVQSTSRDSGIGDDIVLRETETTRLVFRPEIVNNIHDSNAPIKGSFNFQKKRKKDSWEDHKEFETSKLKADEWIKIAIDTGETLKLFDELKKYYKVHEEYGVKHGSYTLYKTNPDLEKVIALFEGNNELFIQLLDEDKSDVLEQALEWIVNAENSNKMVDKLSKLRETELDQLNTLVGLTNLKKLLAVWEGNKDNNSEKFWQDLLKENTWVLSQLFSNPTVLIEDEAYVGGKTTNNDSGKLVDFLYANPFSKDAVLIEIKTPTTPLVTSTEYRTGVHSAHKDLMGAVAQVLTYKGTLQSEYSNILVNNIRNGKNTDYDVINPCCVVIAGRFDALEELSHKHSFELYRKELKNVIVITFDELFMKIRSLIDLLEK